MLYHFLYPLSQDISGFNIFRYITFRTFAAFLIATIFSIVWGQYFIKFMKRKQFGQIVRDDGPESHLKKAGTPTMGGVFIIGTIFVTMLVTANFFSIPVLVTLGVTYLIFF